MCWNSDARRVANNFVVLAEEKRLDVVYDVKRTPLTTRHFPSASILGRYRGTVKT